MMRTPFEVISHLALTIPALVKLDGSGILSSQHLLYRVEEDILGFLARSMATLPENQILYEEDMSLLQIGGLPEISINQHLRKRCLVPAVVVLLDEIGRGQLCSRLLRLHHTVQSRSCGKGQAVLSTGRFALGCLCLIWASKVNISVSHLYISDVLSSELPRVIDGLLDGNDLIFVVPIRAISMLVNQLTRSVGLSFGDRCLVASRRGKRTGGLKFH